MLNIIIIFVNWFTGLSRQNCKHLATCWDRLRICLGFPRVIVEIKLKYIIW